MSRRILIVDDDPSIVSNMAAYFVREGYEVRTASSGEPAIKLARQSHFHVILLDLHLPDIGGLEVLSAIRSFSEDTRVIILTAYGSVATAVEATKTGADNFALKPIDLRSAAAMVNQSYENYQERLKMRRLQDKLAQLEGRPHDLLLPPAVQAFVEVLSDNTEVAALILGESGTGKGMVAAYIHEHGPRRDGPFVDINCATLSTELVESELFGHERGAFTDAKQTREGLFEVASGGTIFLDEVGEMAPSTQSKLLKVIEDHLIRRVGGNANIKVDARIIAATNVDLKKAVKDGRFREDLYYRLAVMPIELPPLRERPEQIAPLSQMFLEQFADRTGRGLMEFSEDAKQRLDSYPWPGNIRELRNVVERAVLLSRGPQIDRHLLPDAVAGMNVAQPSRTLPDDLRLDTVEREHICQVLAHCDGNRSQTARLLGIHRTTLLKKLKQFQISNGEKQPTV